MGASRQKWSSEEEAALKAGVVKHGMGEKLDDELKAQPHPNLFSNPNHSWFGY